MSFILLSALTPGPAQSQKQNKRGLELPVGPSQKIAVSKATSAQARQKPELVLQAGHTKTVNTVVFSPDGRWLASGGNDNTIKIWETATGNILRTFYGHSSHVNALAVSPDGNYLASASGDMMDRRDLSIFKKGGIVGGVKDNTVRIWDVRTGREVRALRGHDLPVGAVAFSGDGHFLTSVSGEAMKVWDAVTGAELSTLKTKYEKSGMEKYDSFRSFSIFGTDKKETQQSEWLKNLKRSASKIVVSSNSQLAAVGQPDKNVKIYDVRAGKEVRELGFLAVPEAENSSIAFSPDARLIAYPKTGDSVSIQEATTGRELYNVPTGFSKFSPRVAFSGSGRFLVTATDGGNGQTALMKLWDASTGKEMRELKTHESSRVISFSPDDRLIATVASGSKTIRLIDVTTGSELRALRTGTAEESERDEQAAFIKSIDAKTLAEFQQRGIITSEQIIDAMDSLGTIANEKFQVGDAVTFSPDGRSLISRHMLLKSLRTEVWDAATGTLSWMMPGNDQLRDRGKPHYSPDGRFRATPEFPLKDVYTTSARDYFSLFGKDDWDKIYDQKVQLYDGRSDAKLRTLNGGKAPDVGIVPAVGFGFDSKLIGITGFEKKERVVFVYETEKGRQVSKIQINEDEQSGAVTTLAISADARFLAAAYATKIDIFEIAAGTTSLTIPQAGRVTALTFSPDGRFLVALGENNDKYIWNTASGEKLATLVNLSGAFSDRANDWLVVTPDGLFDGSPTAWSQILWRFRGDTFDVNPAETFFNEFYYPGLLAEIMAGKKPQAPKNIALLDRRQPDIRLTTEEGHSNIKIAANRNIKVKIEVAEKPADKDHTSGTGARDVRLFRNGTLVKAWRGDILNGEAATTLEAIVPIVAGENNFTAYSFNRDNVKSKDATLILNGDPGLQRKGVAYVITVGINTYENPQYNLKYAVADAQSLSTELGAQQKKLKEFERVEIISLKDQEATKANITAALRRLSGETAGQQLPAGAPEALQQIRPTQPEDVVMIFYAGHGTTQDQHFFLIPHDLGYNGDRTKLDSVGLQSILEHSISDVELEKLLEGIDAASLIMVIDACNSGQALESEEKRRGPMNSRGLAQLAYEKGMYILTAAQGYQAALESAQLGHGYLTYALVEEGLKTPAADQAPQDKSITAREWLDFATRRVPEMQEENLNAKRNLGIQLSTQNKTGQHKPSAKNPDAETNDVQQPRVFYRRDLEVRSIVVAKF